MSKSEYIIEIEEEAKRTAEQVGLSEDVTNRVITAMTKNLVQRWQGLSIYFKLSEFGDREARWNAIVSEYNGRNARLLAQKYHTSIQNVYRIVRKNQVKNLSGINDAPKKSNTDNYDWVNHLNAE